MNHKLLLLETLSKLDLIVYELIATSHGHIAKGLDLVLIEVNGDYNRDLYVRYF